MLQEQLQKLQGQGVPSNTEPKAGKKDPEQATAAKATTEKGMATPSETHKPTQKTCQSAVQEEVVRIMNHVDANAQSTKMERAAWMQMLNAEAFAREMRENSPDGDQRMTSTHSGPVMLPPGTKEFNYEAVSDKMTPPEMEVIDFHITKVREILSRHNLALLQHVIPLEG